MLLDKINSTTDVRHLNFDSLLQLCKEVRQTLIHTISKTGGHLGASLGVIELTIALHHVFNTPKDILIWDVGHQSHPHKIITGRRDKIMTLKQEGGLSGFAKRSESEYDPFGAGHSSTSISAALGMEVAKNLKSESKHVIAVIGDGAMSAGMAYEALNNAGALNNRLIVILNDNDMSISPSTGALTKHLASLQNAKKTVIQKVKKAFSSNIFENLGFHYIGPIDGHDMKCLVDTLSHIKNDITIDQPILLHVLTEKGKGFYSPNGGEEEAFHAVKQFCVETGTQVSATSANPSYTEVFAKQLIADADADSKIIAITAAMPSGTGLNKFQKKFPDRCFDTGIAEQHAVTFAAGLACEGMKPFVAIYSTFLQRAFDQVVHDVAIQKLPVRFAIDRAGLVGCDGPTHAGSFDVAYLTMLPNFVVMAASDAAQLKNMVHTAAHYNDGPISFRYPRGESVGSNNEPAQLLEIGKGRIIQEGKDVAILSFGTRLAEVKIAAEILQTRYGIDVTIADAMFAKPLDTELIKNLIKDHPVLITIEEGSIGGFGAHVNNFILHNDLHHGRAIKNLYLPDTFIDHGSVYNLYENAGLNASGILKLVLDVLKISNVAIFKHKVS